MSDGGATASRASERPVWLVLADPLSTRVLVESGVVARLVDELGERLQPVFLLGPEAAAPWQKRITGARPALQLADIYPPNAPLPERVLRRIDRWLDRRLGYFPLAIRLNHRHGFHRERMAPGHRNELLDASRVGPLPRRERFDALMTRWHFSPRRHIAAALMRRLEADRPLLVLSNLQMQSAVPFILGAKRLGLPVVGNVASWDHTVGKGVIHPGLERYIVQNTRMRDDLARYHGVPSERIVVTGWPQSDVFARPRRREEFDTIVAGHGLDPALPLVLVMGNTPTNTPTEGLFFERLVRWWRETGADGRFQLLFRPHPRDRAWQTRFAAALDGGDGIAVQEPSFTDIEALATVLQYGGCVVTNAGTILVDALVNDRPVVCVLYDEGAEAGDDSWAAKSVIGEHYRDVAESGAFLEAHSFEDVVAGIERSLAEPGELAEQRRAVVATVVGVVDGHAAERVATAILEVGDR